MSWSTGFVQVALALSPFAVGAATGLLAKGAQYALHAVSGIKNANLRNGLDWAIGQAESLVHDAVIAANQTTVNALKATKQWDATAASKVFHDVLASVTGSLSTQARAILERELPDLPGYLGTIIETNVATAPNKHKPVAPAAS